MPLKFIPPKHSPAPWEFHIPSRTVNTFQGENEICELIPPPCCQDNGQMEPDGLLIQAAPKMAHALRLLLTSINGHQASKYISLPHIDGVTEAVDALMEAGLLIDPLKD